jgi:cell wall-associated NlpC family hydrolase
MTRRTQTAIGALNKQRLARKQSLSKTIDSQKAILATLTAKEQTTVIGAGGTTAATYTGSTSTQAGKAVQYAYSKLGDPYSYGAAGPSAFDCSGLTSAAWAYAGIAIPRTSYSQAGAGYPAVPKSDLQPGDLVFFNGDSHVGMYVGGGDMIDAPTTGSFVERVSLSGSWYVANYDGAVRP